MNTFKVGSAIVLTGALALAQAQTAPTAGKAPASQAVQKEVDKQAAQAAQEKRRQLIGEAQSAIAETEKALVALKENRSKEALGALASATGKLEIILARNPKLALAPVRTDAVTHELLATDDAVKVAIKEARRLLNDGAVQKARQLLDTLTSEIELRTLNIPLHTYPAAIKAVTPLIDAGNTDEAITRLQTLLDTLVVTTEVLPLPKLRAGEELKAAQALAEKKNRSKEEGDKITEHLRAAREQLKLADMLGYGDKKDFQPMYEQIDQIAKNTEGGKSGLGWFDRIKRQIAELGKGRSS
jgi:hypothetical protein